MEIETVFGVKWRIPTIYDISLILGIILIVIVILIGFKYYLKKKERRAHLYQLFLFKAYQLGLSNYQIKILNSIAGTLKVKNPNILFHNPYLFESSIGNFLSFLNTQDEHEDSLNLIFKDIIMIYQKVYYPSGFKKPLDDIREIEHGQILFFTIRNKNYYLGKILRIENDHLLLALLTNQKNHKQIEDNIGINVYLWRTGDAEYMFNSHIIAKHKTVITMALPEKIIRGQEVRHPSIGVDIPCTITYNPHPKDEESKQTNKTDDLIFQENLADIEYDEIEASILKLNIDEALLRIKQKLLYDNDYFINFELDGFKVKIVAVIITEKTNKASDAFYYTLKFKEMTEASREVLHKFIFEHLH